MPPARVPIPPYLRSPTWASLTSTTIPTRHLRAVLRLPGELRPLALRSFYSLAYREQLQHIGTSWTGNELAPNGLQVFPNEGLAGSSLGDGREFGIGSAVEGKGGNKEVQSSGVTTSSGVDGDDGIAGETEAIASSDSSGNGASVWGDLRRMRELMLTFF
jgi:hypothetical protein